MRKTQKFSCRLIEVGYVSKVDAHPNLLSSFLISARFQDFLAQLPDQKISDDIMWLLNRSLRLGTLPTPIGVIRSSWITQPNFRGSYAYLSMATFNAGITTADLAAPVGSTLFFAGEATSDFYGYANGAVESGFRAAQEVLSLA